MYWINATWYTTFLGGESQVIGHYYPLYITVYAEKNVQCEVSISSSNDIIHHTIGPIWLKKYIYKKIVNEARLTG